MYPEAPWTQMGALQQEINSFKYELERKVENHEIHSINSRLDSMEHTLREISAILNEFTAKMQVCEDRIESLSREG